MNKLKKTTKIVIYDSLGVLCIIGSILFGWLPGPGGIPLFLIGLGLIATHHDWAERYITIIKKYADNIGDLVFVDTPAIQALYDSISLVLVGLSAYLLYSRPNAVLLAFGLSSGFIAILIFLRNRHRYNRIKAKIRN